MNPLKTIALILALSVLGWSGLAHGAEIHDAARLGDLEQIKALVQAKPQLVSAETEGGRTPLHFAANEGHKAVVEFLLSNNGDPNIKDETGSTPLHRAALARRMGVLTEKFAAAGLTDKAPVAFTGGGDFANFLESFLTDLELGDLPASLRT